MSEPPRLDRDFLRRRRVAVGVAGAVLLLALVETASALYAPFRAPTDADWRAAAAEVRAGHQKGDLVVAAPAWADQVLRLHLGDLLPVPVAGRMDAARYGRVWQIGQRGETSPDAEGNVTKRSRHGALTLSLVERKAAVVTFDFVADWKRARVMRVDAGRGEIPCALAGDRHQCPDIGFNFVQPKLVEVDTTLRNALLAQPVGGATVAVEYAGVPLGRELAVATGLHHVWLRKAGEGTVALRVLVDGKELGKTAASNRSGWRVERFDTAAHAGKTGTVRFEISSAAPYARHFAFAAEARS